MNAEGFFGDLLEIRKGCGNIKSQRRGAGVFEVSDLGWVASRCDDGVAATEGFANKGRAKAAGAARDDPDFLRHGSNYLAKTSAWKSSLVYTELVTLGMFEKESEGRLTGVHIVHAPFNRMDDFAGPSAGCIDIVGGHGRAVTLKAVEKGIAIKQSHDKAGASSITAPWPTSREI